MKHDLTKPQIDILVQAADDVNWEGKPKSASEKGAISLYGIRWASVQKLKEAGYVAYSVPSFTETEVTEAKKVFDTKMAMARELWMEDASAGEDAYAIMTQALNERKAFDHKANRITEAGRQYVASLAKKKV